MDVIWGITYDESLGDKVKFTILASGFDVTVDEATGKKISASAAPVSTEPVTIDTTRISELYGSEKIENYTRSKETQNYILLPDDQLDDDAAIERFEKSPTFTRDKRMAAAASASVAPAPSKPAEPEEPGAFRVTFGDED